MPTKPILSIQTASLAATGDNSTWTGTGGPAAFDPFLSEFSDIVTSDGIAANPFEDEVYDVDAGDQVTFVIAVQNSANSASAYDITLRDIVPVGFALPDVSDLTVTDGTGTVLSTSGNLFDPNGGLTIQGPIAPFSDTSGTNVLLVTFSLQATQSLSVPLATVTNSAQIVSYAASEGGPNLSGSDPLSSLLATTSVQTGSIGVSSLAQSPPDVLEPGHTASFDVTITLPEGTVDNLTISEILPQTGSSWLNLVGVAIKSFGGNLSATAPVAVEPDGTVALGNVTNTPDNVSDAGDQITLEITVSGGGTAAGPASLQTVVTAADPNTQGGTWSNTTTNTIQLDTPDTPPTIGGISPAQNATTTMGVLPFAGLVLTDPDANQVQTLTIHLSDPALGTLAGAGATVNANGDLVISGAVATVQAEARALLFTPGAAASGTETFSLRLDDGYGGVATNGATTLAVATAADTSSIAHFPLSTTQTILTSTATGSSTVAQVESYAGPADASTQFVYDGSTPLAMVALQSDMLIQSLGNATAVQALGGVNTINIRRGSGFITSGTGIDTFLFDATQSANSWNTIVNFHTGDQATVFGFRSGVSTYSWDASAGATGYTGLTLRMDLDANGVTDTSLTLTGKTTADEGHFRISTGNTSGADFIQITAL